MISIHKMSVEDKRSSPEPQGKKKVGKQEASQGKGAGSVGKGEKAVALDSSENGDVLENPYVMVISKKIRGLRKKMERIKSMEEQLASGKVRQSH